MRTRLPLLLLLAASLPTTSCVRSGAKGERVRVVAAASMRDAMEELVDAFAKRSPGVGVDLVATASGAAAEQILNGAPYDIFFSADTRSPRSILDRGRGLPDTLRVYARGRLALWIPARTGLAPNSLEVLTDPRIRRVAIANPEIAAYGRAAQQALQAAGLWEAIEGKLVFGQDVAQVAQQALTAADAALLPLANVLTGAVAEAGGASSVVPAELHAPIEHASLVLRDAPAVRAFDEFVRSDAGRAILRARGFDVP